MQHLEGALRAVQAEKAELQAEVANNEGSPPEQPSAPHPPQLSASAEAQACMRSLYQLGCVSDFEGRRTCLHVTGACGCSHQQAESTPDAEISILSTRPGTCDPQQTSEGDLLAGDSKAPSVQDLLVSELALLPP